MGRVMNVKDKVDFLREFWAKERRIPSYSEMMKAFGYRSKNAVACAVNRLAALGYLSKDEQGHVSVLPKLTGAVRVLGSVAAGFPVDEEQQEAEAVTLDEYLVQNPDQSYLLTVRGESMINAGIQPGDLVLVEKGREPKPNDIVVACVDGEWTLKYYMVDRVGIRLEPANPAFRFIRPKRSLEIGGVVRAVIRKYE